MKPKWQKLASLAQEICTLWFQFSGAIFASKRYPFKNIFQYNGKPNILSSLTKRNQASEIDRKLLFNTEKVILL